MFETKDEIRLVGVQKEDYSFDDKVKHKLFWNYKDKKYFILNEYSSGQSKKLYFDFNPGIAKVQYNTEIFNPNHFTYQTVEIARHWTNNNKYKLFYNFSGHLFIEMLWDTNKIRKVFFNIVDYKDDPYQKYLNTCINKSYLH
jgi:hypothetical protein